MTEKERKIRCGIFLVSGVLLLLLILFFLGGRDLFTPKAEVRTYFPESVQGLARGSAVKYRGAPIGTVSGISIQAGKRMVQVDMEIDLDAFGGTEENFRRLLRQEMQQGLRCRMEFLGVTGMKFIDWDYFVPPGSGLPQMPDFAGDPRVCYIPSVPSAFKDIHATLVASLERLSRIKFEEISDGLDRSLSELSALLSDPAIKATINNINETAVNLSATTGAIAEVLDEQQLKELTVLIDKNLQNMARLTARIEAETARAGISDSAIAIKEAARAVSDSRSDLQNTLEKFNQLMDSVKMLTDYLEKDPASLVYGKQLRPRQQ